MKTLGELAHLVGGTLKGDPQTPIRGINALENARPDELSFLTPKHYSQRKDFRCRAAALVVPPSLEHLDYPLLIVDNPLAIFARIAQLFATPPFLAPGIHTTAHIGENVRLEPGVSVGPLAHIGSGSQIAQGCRIYGGVYLGCDVQIGEGSLIYPRVTILDGCQIGNRVIIHSGTVIGSDGFGFAQDELGRHIKIPQMGTVHIDDDVEIGANCTIDRGAFGKTTIQEGTKIDNMVHIAHNVVVGKHCILVAQVGISGSTRLGHHVIMGGQVGVVDHIEIGNRVRVGAKSGVARSVKDGEDISGIPAVPHKEWLRMCASARRLPHFRDELRQMKERIERLEKALQGSEDD
jgi:UDP-3-O-[3-hydroxymyristoyl] glucosamine N-acyltransferase